METFSSGLLGGSAPIDFQDFAMAGARSIHEVYSTGHDPLRFIEGISQFLTGQFVGFDRYGKPITAVFGATAGNPAVAIAAFAAHMIADFCNANSLPYPGATLLAQFGSQETRDHVAAAYRGQLWNARTFAFQSMAPLCAEIIVRIYAAMRAYERAARPMPRTAQPMPPARCVGQAVSAFFGGVDGERTRRMLLISHAVIAGQNILVSGARVALGEPHAIFRLNLPVIMAAARYAVPEVLAQLRRSRELDAQTQELDTWSKSLVKPRQTREQLELEADAYFEAAYRQTKAVEEKKHLSLVRTDDSTQTSGCS
jgi:hypothetical protein